MAVCAIRASVECDKSLSGDTQMCEDKLLIFVAREWEPACTHYDTLLGETERGHIRNRSSFISVLVKITWYVTENGLSRDAG